LPDSVRPTPLSDRIGDIIGRILSRSVPAAYGACAPVGNRGAALALTLAATLSVAAPAQAAPVSLVALGDSLTQGYGLPEAEGFVPQLEAWLRARGHDVTVINAGVSGDTTAGGLARVAWTLDGGGDAMIVALGGNDLLRGLDPALSRANLRGILEVARERGVPVLLIGLPAPGNYGPEFKAAFEAMYPELAAEFGVLYLPSFLAPLEGRAGEGQAMRELVQPDGIHPSAAGVALIVEAVGPSVEALLAQVAR
jgi:acyl-CoA thioesterase-1